MAFRAAGPAIGRHAKAKGLAKLGRTRHAGAESACGKSVDASPAGGAGGYSPVTRVDLGSCARPGKAAGGQANLSQVFEILPRAEKPSADKARPAALTFR